MYRALGSFNFGGLTASSGTAITCLIPPHPRGYSRLTRVQYRPGATAHALVFMKAFGSTTVTTAQVATDTTVILAADPGAAAQTPDGIASPAGTLATNDWLCIQLDDGTYFLAQATVSSLTCTIAALPAAVSVGNRVWTFGATGDHPVSSQTTQKTRNTKGFTITTTASAMNEYGDYAAGILQSLAPNMPLMLYSANGTNAGVLEAVSGVYTTN